MELEKKAYAWTVLPSYDLSAYFSTSIKNILMRLRMGDHYTKELIPSWKKNRHVSPNCRLCNYSRESLEHLICVCPALNEIRRSMLLHSLRQLGTRTCRSTVILLLRAHSIPTTCKMIKFLRKVTTLLEGADVALKLKPTNVDISYDPH